MMLVRFLQYAESTLDMFGGLRYLLRGVLSLDKGSGAFNKFKYLGVMFNVEKTLHDVDVIRRNLFAAWNCILGNSKNQNEIVKLCPQELYALPVLQYACSAVRFTKLQLNDLNVCWNFVYRRIFDFLQV